MKTQTAPQNIYQKLLSIQQKVMGLGKDAKSFGYGYVTGSKALEHIKPLMNELGLILKQEVIGFTNERQDYTTKNGSKSEILTKVDMKFTWIDTETGEKEVLLWHGCGMNDWEKGLGSALTYAERYFLLKYFHISTDEDDIDNPDRKEPEPEPVPIPTPISPNTISEAQKKRLFAISKERGKTTEEIKEIIGKFGYNSTADIKTSDYNKIIESIKQ
jgi:hypothetical protein